MCATKGNELNHKSEKPSLKIVPLLLSGGSGKRLWPISSPSSPKQYSDKILPNKRVLFLEALELVSRKVAVEQSANFDEDDNLDYFLPPVMVSNVQYKKQHLEQLKRVGVDTGSSVFEFHSKNTLPAITTGILACEKKYGKDLMIVVLSTDHLIENKKQLRREIVETIREIQGQAEPFSLFGIDSLSPFKKSRPPQGARKSIGVTKAKGVGLATIPSVFTEYGYIKHSNTQCNEMNCEETYNVEKFIEKPSAFSLRSLARKKNVLCNMGIFAFNSSYVLKQIQLLESKLIEEIHRDYKKAEKEAEKEADSGAGGTKWSPSVIEFGFDSYSSIEGKSFDKSIVQKLAKLTVRRTKASWQDMGSYHSILSTIKLDTGSSMDIESNKEPLPEREFYNKKNKIVGKAELVDSSNSAVINNTDLDIKLSNVSNIMIVANDDGVLVSQNPEVSLEPLEMSKPWGTHSVVQEVNNELGMNYKIKTLTIYPKQALSLQVHYKRDEQWTITQGIAHVIRDDMELVLHAGDSITIPRGMKHRVTNHDTTELKILEVQTGQELSEDDIIRLDDLYGRDVHIAQHNLLKANVG